MIQNLFSASRNNPGEHNLHINPFALSTASSQWQKKESLPQRCIKTAFAASYDVLYKNPYELTVGNAKNVLFHSNTTKIEKISASIIALLGCMYSAVLHGTLIYALGSTLLALSKPLNIAILTKTSEAIKIVGEKIFLVGSVPAYGIFYAMPKHLMQKIPEILQTIADKVVKLSQYVFRNILLPLWENILQPALKAMDKAITWAIDKMAYAIQWLVDKIADIARVVFDNILQPLWENVLQPALKAMDKVFTWTIDKMAYAMQWFADKITDIARVVFDNVLQPLWENVLQPVLKAMDQVFTWAVKQVSAIVQNLTQKTIDVARWVFHNILTPVFSFFYDASLIAGRYISKYVISPLTEVVSYGLNIAQKGFAAVARKIVNIFLFVYKTVIFPMLRLTQAALSNIKFHAKEIAESLYKKSCETWAVLQKIFFRQA